MMFSKHQNIMAVALAALFLPLPFNITTLGPNFCRVDYSTGERVVTGWTASGIPCDVLYPPGIDPPHY